MDNDDITTIFVFLFFIILFILWIVLKKKLGEKKLYQLFYIIIVPIVFIYLCISGVIGTLFLESIGTIIMMLLVFIGMFVFWIYAIKEFFDK